MRIFAIFGIIIAALSVGACSKSTTTNPATSNLEDLNPPGGLVTVTHDGAIELHWKASNTESDFKGYNVFVTPGAVSALTAPAFPASKTLAADSVPRCTLNSKTFETFGFPVSQADCSGDPAAAVTPAASTSGLMDATTDSDPDDTPITTMSICDGNADTTISLPGTVPTLGNVTCTIKEVTDAKGKKTAIANGTLYTFFVVAVKGDAKDSISWASNFVQDTPAVQFYSNPTFTLSLGTAAENGGVWVLPAATLATITAGKALASDMTPWTTKTDCTGYTAPNDPCVVNNVNNETAADGIYIARQGSFSNASYPERIFLSTPAGGSIQLQSRGAQGYNPTDGTIAVSVPGDEASSVYYSGGTLYPIYGDEVFDFQYTDPTSKDVFYGKLVFGAETLATPTVPTSDLKVPLTIVMQSNPKDADY